MEPSNGYSQMSTLDDSQAFNVGGEYQFSEPYTTTTSTANNNTQLDTEIQSWEHLLGEKIGLTNSYPNSPPTEGTGDQSVKMGFSPQGDSFNFKRSSPTEKLNPETDYETLVRAKNLYYDPEPKVIRKSSTANPVVYNQNIMVRFLQPPPVPQGPLIIREVRAPQPPPPPPLVIRQHPPPPLSPPPIILREKPPSIPSMMTAKVITKTLPPIPPPPRSVIIENLPRLPPKPRDVIIERWIPYESIYKRPVIVHRAKEAKPYPPPKNIIITYEPIQTCIVRQFQRLGVTPEDPTNYSKNYGDSLLDSDQLLAQIKELGINVDLSPPPLFNNSQQDLLNNTDALYNKSTNNSPQKQLYGEVNNINMNYAPTFENLIQGTKLTRRVAESNVQKIGNEQFKFFPNNGEDLTSQFAHFGISPETIPY
ncbi:hypothetical protein I4U23_013778 [Adineta vaga]|nr:hypothetical protein I4U23_013778 [Adineta vaga]